MLPLLKSAKGNITLVSSYPFNNPTYCVNPCLRPYSVMSSKDGSKENLPPKACIWTTKIHLAYSPGSYCTLVSWTNHSFTYSRFRLAYQQNKIISIGSYSFLQRWVHMKPMSNGEQSGENLEKCGVSMWSVMIAEFKTKSLMCPDTFAGRPCFWGISASGSKRRELAGLFVCLLFLDCKEQIILLNYSHISYMSNNEMPTHCYMCRSLQITLCWRIRWQAGALTAIKYILLTSRVSYLQYSRPQLRLSNEIH